MGKISEQAACMICQGLPLMDLFVKRDQLFRCDEPFRGNVYYLTGDDDSRLCLKLTFFAPIKDERRVLYVTYDKKAKGLAFYIYEESVANDYELR